VIWEPSLIDGNENLAYSGRLGVFEVIKMNPDIEAAVEAQSGEHEIQEIARTQKTLTMIQDAVVKALQGVTSLSEVRRVLDVTKFES
jgi:type II secretory ATPase GspE/PulE/Tfp pilus assembly ATPase PilB-like protein